ncbi:MAG: hypothetical protein NWE83_13855 [Candidatus Bathyarchaeota archaeon]|nr:hypothetical protein [Candidatus Bathyarchaeota archaeon]
MLRNNAPRMAKSGRDRDIHVFCVERNCVIEEGFCHYVCPKTQECPLWNRNHELFHSMTKPIYYDQRPRPDLPAMKPRQPHTLPTKPHPVNFLPNQVLESPTTTIHQVNDLRNAPWIGHVKGYKWPECECPACCSELLINLMRETHKSYRQKPQNLSHKQASLT